MKKFIKDTTTKIGKIFNDNINPKTKKRPKIEFLPDTVFSSLITEEKYPYEVYYANTDDGYILRLFRIQASGQSNIIEGKKPIFLQHGLLDSADAWVINGKDKALGLFLADKGYDVWIGNSRGNKYSEGHVNIDITQQKYYDFCFVEQGQFDVPANIRLISEKTKQKVVYIGHSQGTSQMFAALCDDLTYEFINEHVEKFIALAPVCYLCNVDNPLLQKMTTKLDLLLKTLNNAGIFYIPPTGAKQSKFNAYTIDFLNKKFPVLSNFILKANDLDPEYDMTEKMPLYLKHFPSGASIMQHAIFGQMIGMSPDYPLFRKFHYKEKGENLRRYGTEIPPTYDFRRINIPVALFVGMQDRLANPTDCDFLKERLLEAGVNVSSYLYDKCDHQTFMWGRYPEQIFYDIYNEILEVESKPKIEWHPDIHGGIDWAQQTQAEDQINQLHDQQDKQSFKRIKEKFEAIGKQSNNFEEKQISEPNEFEEFQ